MFNEIKSHYLTLFFEGDDQAHDLLDYFKVTAVVMEEFLFSNNLKINNNHFESIECSISICDGESIQALNKNFRKLDKITDVLSFPVHDNLREKGELFGLQGNLELGDVVICGAVAENQARKFNITFEQEVIHLVVHGILHLIGFDHEASDIEEKIMFDHEDKLVKKIYQKLGL